MSGLSLSGTTYWHPSFSASATSYAVQVGADTSETTVTATANHRAASVDIERKRSWGAWTDSDGTIPLERGQNRVRIEVTAQDTTTTKTYYILITRTSTPFPTTLGELSTDDPPVNFRITGFDHDSAGVQWEVPKDRHISQYKLTLYENSGSGFVDIGRSVDDEATGGSSVGWSNLRLKADTQYRYDLDLMNDARIAIIQKSATLRTEPEPAPASTDATLSNLTLSGIDIGTFDSGTTSYSASVANSVSQTTVTPTLNDSEARYSIVANNTLYHSGTVQLRAGSNTIEVTVTAEDGQTRKTYTVTVTRARPPATLNSLTLSGVSISFDWETESYTASVANSVSETTVAAAVHNSGDTYVVKLNGVADSDGVIPLAVGSNVITVEVASQDGNSTITYTVTVTRAAPLSADATLSGLSLSGTTYWHPSFSASATSYAVQVGADTSETTVTATANHRAASVDIERKRSWGAWTDSDGTIPLERGQNRVRIEVTAQDTTTTKTYYILITRTSTPFPTTLGELSTDDPPVNFRITGFDHDSAGVQWEVPKDRHISQYKLTLYENSGSGFVDIGRSVDDEATGGSSVGWSNLRLKADTQYRYDLDLMNDARIAIIQKSATLRTEPEPAPASTDATLSNLTLSGIDIGTFDSGTTSYSASVANSVSQTTVTPTLNDSEARYSIVANNTLYHSGTVQLRAGSNTIEVTVTAEDGQTRKTYTVTVTRARPPATLNSLTLSGVSISFDWETASYTASVANSVSETTVAATVHNSGDTYVVKLNGVADSDGVIPLAVGSNVITVEVASQDGNSTRTYTVTVTRATPLSADATLSGLSLSGIDIGTFDSGTTAYTASVANSVSQTTVTATVHNSGDTYVVKLNGVNYSDGVIPLAVGSNVITVEVASQDGNTRTYTVTATRAAPLSTDATLSNLTLSGIDIGTFDSGTTSYSASVANSVSQTTVTPTLNDSEARYSIVANNTLYHSGTVQLRAGSNTIEVTVTAEDGQTRKTYTVTVTRAEESLLDRYDVNDDRSIDKSEVFTAIYDYFDNVINIAQLMEVIQLYFSSTT